jgi:hypothetical protein
MYHTTGFTKAEIRDLCAAILAATDSSGKSPWPPVLGLYRSVIVVLTYLRRNRVQAELAEAHEVSQPTISRAITRLTPILKEQLQGNVPTADELEPSRQYIVDGTLLPCWSWATNPGLYSGKHKTTGLSVQVACTLDGDLAWVSDAIDGARHDSFALNDSGVLVTLDPAKWVGDKGYVGNGMLTPYKKPAGGGLNDWQKEYNSQINKTRWIIEQVIANLKTWRILHTDYRRPIKTFRETISCVIALHFYRMTRE